MKKAFFGLGFLVFMSPAEAARCPYGQILRVHLNECVSVHSVLARAYVGRPLHLSYRRVYIPEPIPVARPADDPAASDTVRMMKATIIPAPSLPFKPPYSWE